MSVAACDSALLPTADDTSSAVTSSHSAASVAAGARGTSARANDGSPLELIYYGESGDESDSKKSVRLPGSPWATQSEPSERKLAHTTREVSSSTLSLGLMVMSVMVHHLCRVMRTHKCAISTITTMARAMAITVVPTTSVGINQKALDRKTLRQSPEHKPWRLPELVINSLSGGTSEHHQIPLFDASRLHCLQHSD